jgi:hypothetical protein
MHGASRVTAPPPRASKTDANSPPLGVTARVEIEPPPTYFRRGALRVGALRVGALRVGALRLGALRLGVVREGALRDGVVRDGLVRDGMVRDGAERDGLVRDGVDRDGALGIDRLGADGVEREGDVVRVGDGGRPGELGRLVPRNGSEGPPVRVGRTGAVCRGDTACDQEGVRVGDDGREENASRLGGARNVGAEVRVGGLLREGAEARLPAGSITVTRWPSAVVYVRERAVPGRAGSGLDHTEPAAVRCGPVPAASAVASLR